MLTDTGERHAHATGGYAARRASCEQAAQALGVPALRDLDARRPAQGAGVLDDETFRRVRHVVTENARVLETVAALEAGATWTPSAASSPRRTAPCATTTRSPPPALDLAVETALAAGALGARMTGGGFGGSAITLIDASMVPALRAAVEDAFAAARFAAPRISIVTPSAGAHKEA